MSDAEGWTIINVDGTAHVAPQPGLAGGQRVERLGVSPAGEAGLSDEQRAALLRVLSADQSAAPDLRALRATPVPSAEPTAPERVTDAELMVVGSIQYVTSLLPGQALGLLKRMAAELRALRALVSGGHEGDAAEHLKAAREALEASPGESICGAARRAQSSLASLRAPVDVDAEVDRGAEDACLRMRDFTGRPESEALRAIVRPHAESDTVLAREADGLRAETQSALQGLDYVMRTLAEALAEAGETPEIHADKLAQQAAEFIVAANATHDDEEAAHQETLGMLNAARAEIERLRSVLRAVEWSGVPDGGDPDDMPGGCPSCGASETDGKHVPHCALAARLGNEPAPMSALAVDVERLKAELAEAVEGLETSHDEQQAAAELNARLAADAKNEIERLTKERDAALAGEKYLSKVVGKLTKERDDINALLCEAGIESVRGVTSRSLDEPLAARVQRLIADANTIEKAAQAVSDDAEWAEEDGPTAKRPACLVDGQLLDALDEALGGKPR